MSEIVEFYRGKNILITGAAGFLGGLLMERLLRICEVGRIFIIVRDKNGLKAEERLDSIFSTPVFDRLRQLKPSFLNSVQLVKGDIGLPGLGLSDLARAMLVEEIEVVFHGAATVSFDEPIKKATLVNVRGTKEMALLCQEMKNLKALVHVSTAYSNSLNLEINERFYDPPITTDELINICERLSDEDLTITAGKYLEGWPNTYVFTKCVAEEAIKVYAAEIPTCIFRPAIIICTKLEPIEGWIDNYYGPSGVIALVENGFARVARADYDANADFVPADMCVNVILTAGQEIGKVGFDGEMKIFNFAPSPQNCLTWKQFVRYFVAAGERLPSAKAVWCPSLIALKSKLAFFVVSFIYHFLPALIVDVGLVVCQKKPKALRLARKMSKFLHLISYFSCKNWRFTHDNLTALWRGLSPTDKFLFDFDIANVDWEEIITTKVRGTRKYLFKEHEKTIPSAQKRRFRLLVIDRMLHAVLMLLMSNIIVKFIYKSLNT